MPRVRSTLLKRPLIQCEARASRLDGWLIQKIFSIHSRRGEGWDGLRYQTNVTNEALITWRHILQSSRTKYKTSSICWCIRILCWRVSLPWCRDSDRGSRKNCEPLALSQTEIRIKGPSCTDDGCSAWKGAKLLSEHPAFPQMCISKEEYDVWGPVMVHRKCFEWHSVCPGCCSSTLYMFYLLNRCWDHTCNYIYVPMGGNEIESASRQLPAQFRVLFNCLHVVRLGGHTLACQGRGGYFNLSSKLRTRFADCWQPLEIVESPLSSEHCSHVFRWGVFKSERKRGLHQPKS